MPWEKTGASVECTMRGSPERVRVRGDSGCYGLREEVFFAQQFEEGIPELALGADFRWGGNKLVYFPDNDSVNIRLVKADRYGLRKDFDVRLSRHVTEKTISRRRRKPFCCIIKRVIKKT